MDIHKLFKELKASRPNIDKDGITFRIINGLPSRYVYVITIFLRECNIKYYATMGVGYVGITIPNHLERYEVADKFEKHILVYDEYVVQRGVQLGYEGCIYTPSLASIRRHKIKKLLYEYNT